MFLIDRSRWWTPRLRVRGALRRHPRRCRRPQPPDAGQCRFVARYHIYELIFWKILLADVENQCIQARKLATKMLEISCWIFLCFPRVWYFFPLFRTVDPAAEAGRPDGGAGGSRDGQPAVGADRQEGWRLVRPDSPDGCHLCALNRQKELVVSAQPLSELNLILPHLFFCPAKPYCLRLVFWMLSLHLTSTRQSCLRHGGAWKIHTRVIAQHRLLGKT